METREAQIRKDAIRYVGANYDKEQLDLLLSGETQPHPVHEEPLIRAYIAGAHRRDEEIEDLEFRLRDKKADIQFLESCIAELKNPWIKPSEQMPVDGDDIVYLLYEGKAGRMKYHSTYEKWLLESVTHWMKVTLKE